MREFKVTNTRAEVKEESDGGMYISGYFSTFGDPPDSWDDIIEPGAFAKTIRERGPEGSNDIVGMWRHYDPFGIPKEIREDKKGGWFRIRLTDSRENREDRWPYLIDKVVKQVSFAFDPIKWFVEEEKYNRPIRHLEEMALYEISPVPFGANSLTSIDGFKSMFAALDPKLIEAIKTMSGGQPDNPEDIFAALSGYVEEIGKYSKSGRIITAANRKLITSTVETLEALIETSEPEASTPQGDEPPQAKAVNPDYVQLADLNASLKLLRESSKLITNSRG